MTVDSPRQVTTTDALKLIGVLAFLVDHVGFFFDPSDPWWRLVGRIAAPIFFFLVGFAHARRVPWTWPVFGVLLTLSLAAVSGTWTLNILLNFALLRTVVLPLVERHVMPRPWAVAALGGLCLALLPSTDTILEYGTEGWLWAFFGLGHRLALERGGRNVAMASALGVLASGAYLLRETWDYRFDAVQSALLAIIVASLFTAFLRFRRTGLPWQPAEPLAAIFRFCGNHSLEIYAFSLFAMELLAYALAQGWWR